VNFVHLQKSSISQFSRSFRKVELTWLNARANFRYNNLAVALLSRMNAAIPSKARRTVPESIPHFDSADASDRLRGARARRHCSLRWTAAALLGLTTAAVSDRASAQRPYGIDVSSSQGGGITWSEVKTSGVTFAWAKATEGTTNWYFDSYFPGDETGAKDAGVLIGAYHYARYDLNSGTSGAAGEAGWFWQNAGAYIKADGLSLMPMLDVEISTNSYTQTTLSQWVNAWCQTVSSLAASNGVYVRPVIYASSSFAGTWFNSTVTNWIPWIANWNGENPQTGNPSPYSPWSTWTVWQWDDTNTMFSGVQPSTDVDVFNGTLAALTNSLVVTNFENVPAISSQPINLTVYQGQNATFTVGASGVGNLSYQWLFNGASIGGATANTYTIFNAQLTNAGGYSVTVTNTNGPALSSTAFLGVIGPFTNGPNAIVDPTGMTNWWPGNGNANDIVGNHTGLPAGAFQYGPGEAGLSFQFNGTNSFLTISNSPPSIPPPWTACFWVNRQPTPQTSAALISDGTHTLKLEQYNDTHEVGMTELAVADWTFSPAYTAPAGTWTHLAFVASGSGASSVTTLYTNGVVEGTIATNIPLGRATIGADYVSSDAEYFDYLKGNLNDIALFDVALSAAQIRAIYSAGASSFVRQPQFLSETYSTASGQFTLNFEGLVGKNITIYGSTDLVSWAALATVPMPKGTNQYVDASAQTNAYNFYRAVSP